MDFSLLYFETQDVVTFFCALVFTLPCLVYLFRSKTPFENLDWTVYRAVLFIPLIVIIFALLFASSRGFAVMRLIYNIGATVYPIIGLSILAVSFRRMRPSWKKKASIILGTLCVLLLPLAFWMTFVEPRWMDITTTEVSTNSGVSNPVRVVVLTDIQTDHFGEWENRIVAETNLLKADIILIPGDLLQAEMKDYPDELQKANHFLSKLRANFGIFIVEGDADREVRKYQAPNVKLLYNQSRKLNIRGRSILISGIELAYGSKSAEKTVHLAEESDAELNIVFSHRPAAVDLVEKASSNIDLFIGGHTHGGQISIPFFGPPITLSPLPRHIGAGGLHKRNGRQIYVSRGLGLERMNAPRLRLNCRPELALLLVK